MAEHDVIERMDELVDAILAGHPSAPVVDAEIALLAAVATDLRTLPDPAFKAELRRRVMPTATVDKLTHHTIVPYLVVNGAPRLIDFVEQAFGGRVLQRHDRPDGSVMHVEMRVGDSTIELADANESYAAQPVEIHFYTDDVDQTYARALRAGGTSLYPLTDQAYGDREGGVVDPLGNYWYIATHQRTGSKPRGFRTITPFMHARGADRLIDFVVRGLGGVELSRDAAPDGSIAHAVTRVGDSVVEVGEAHGDWQPMPATIHLYVPDCDAVYERAIAAGGTSIYPPANQPYGERSGGVADAFGNRWFMATPLA